MRQVVLVLLATLAMKANSDQPERDAIAKAFCGGKFDIVAYAGEKRPVAGNFLFHCSQDKGGNLSAAVETGVLYTIYQGRPKPKEVDEVKILEPKDKRWINWQHDYNEAVTRRSLDYVRRHEGLPK